MYARTFSGGLMAHFPADMYLKPTAIWRVGCGIMWGRACVEVEGLCVCGVGLLMWRWDVLCGVGSCMRLWGEGDACVRALVCV